MQQPAKGPDEMVESIFEASCALFRGDTGAPEVEEVGVAFALAFYRAMKRILVDEASKMTPEALFTARFDDKRRDVVEAALYDGGLE